MLLQSRGLCGTGRCAGHSSRCIRGGVSWRWLLRKGMLGLQGCDQTVNGEWLHFLVCMPLRLLGVVQKDSEVSKSTACWYGRGERAYVIWSTWTKSAERSMSYLAQK